jgi:hypothetical protein
MPVPNVAGPAASLVKARLKLVQFISWYSLVDDTSLLSQIGSNPGGAMKQP